jgi:hypothetical protein
LITPRRGKKLPDNAKDPTVGIPRGSGVVPVQHGASPK